MLSARDSVLDVNGVVCHVDARKQTDKIPEPFNSVRAREDTLLRPAVLLEGEGICAEHAAMFRKDVLLQMGEL
jgi:hypothetical protein